MIVHFDHSWRICSAPGQWRLERLGEPTEDDKGNKERRWNTVGYFLDPRRAVITSWRLQALAIEGQTPGDDTADILMALDALYDSFDQAMDRICTLSADMEADHGKLIVKYDSQTKDLKASNASLKAAEKQLKDTRDELEILQKSLV